MSSHLAVMQSLHGRLLRFQLKISGCSASSPVPLNVQVNFCHYVLVLLCSLWVVRRRGWVPSDSRLLHPGSHVSEVLKRNRMLSMLRDAAEWLFGCLSD